LFSLREAYMKFSLARRRLRMVKHAMQLVLVISAASLLFSCGVGVTPEPTSTVVAKVSMSPSLSTFQPVQCSAVATIAAGYNHTVGLKGDETVVAVGNNSYDQMNVSSWTNIKAIAASAYDTVGLKGDGTVVAVGNNSYSQMNVSSWTNIKAIAAGWYHTVGLKGDGTVVAVGNNSYGQMNVSSWTNIKAIAAGYNHTVGLKEDGTVMAVGSTGKGQLNVSSWTNIKAIAAGYNHTVGLKEDGTVMAVGDNGNGQLNVSTWTNIKAIAAGAYDTVGLKEDGTVVAVGYNSYDQLNVSTWTNIKAIAAGVFHTVGFKEDGTVVAVGYNGNGQLNVSTWANLMPICDTACPPDVTPPITTTLMTGALGNNGWYVSDVLMTLTATDNVGGSGVKEIHYTVDGTETVVQGSLTSHVIAGDGTHTVSWYSIDNTGNVETPSQQISINIDKTAPSITALGTNSAILWPPNHKMVNVVIGGSVADSGSEIASITITVTDEYGVYNRTVSGFGSVIPLEAWRQDADMDGRVYTITAVVTDKAGNKSTGTTTVLVPHDMR
jgi:alpha-tubulin suppressor-like RCC1 family protein